MCGQLSRCLVKVVKSHLRSDWSNGFNLIREMDIQGAVLSCCGCEVLRTIDTKHEKYIRGTLIPCSTELGNICAESVVPVLSRLAIAVAIVVATVAATVVEFDVAIVGSWRPRMRLSLSLLQQQQQ
jgi:hypothetical protein